MGTSRWPGHVYFYSDHGCGGGFSRTCACASALSQFQDSGCGCCEHNERVVLSILIDERLSLPHTSTALGRVHHPGIDRPPTSQERHSTCRRWLRRIFGSYGLADWLFFYHDVAQRASFHPDTLDLDAIRWIRT